MPLYNCDVCKFSSKIKTHYKRHLETFKHLRNIEISLIGSVREKKEPEKSQKEPKRASKIAEKCPKTAKNPEKTAKNPEKTAKNPEKTAKNPEKTAKNPEKTAKNPENPGKFKCKYCLGEFKTYSNKRRHELHRCKNYNAVIERNLLHKEQEIIQLKKQFREDKNEYKKHIELLLSKVGNTTITNNNIQLNSYGNEDMSHITDAFKTNLLKIPYGMIPKMIEAIHFNKSKPENKNILLTNKKDNKIKIYSGDKWVYKNKDDILKKIMDGNYFILDEHYEEICTKIEKFKILNYETFRDKYDEKDKDVLNQIKKNSELVLLNNR
jgi:hypothetical protein